jgi:hypothetical protein
MGAAQCRCFRRLFSVHAMLGKQPFEIYVNQRIATG